ncbi:MAG TPA: hypothetical protein VIX87_12855 [Steroidobacteraceae bacterium]
MSNAAMPLDAWSNFYVIVGGAAGGLTGLTFVVIALVADAHRVALSGLRAFISPTVVHFCSVLGVAALLNVPGQTPSSLEWCLAGGAAAGLAYSVGTTLQLHRNRPMYVPVISDWIWNALLPTLAYLLLLVSGAVLRAHVSAALYATAAVSLLLLLIGIHNAWDIAVWFTAERPAAQSEAAKSPAPVEPPSP